MTIESTGSARFANTYSILQKLNEEKQLLAQATEINQEEATSGTTQMGKDIMSYLSEVPKGDDGTLSFQDVSDYSEQLGSEWDTEVMSDLQKLGIDITQQFPMTYDPDTGKVTVSDAHPDKETINQYFEENPDKVAEFEKIIQLGKLNTAASNKLSQSQMMLNMKQQSLSLWYENNTPSTSWFDGGSLLANQGQTSYTGLNLVV